LWNIILLGFGNGAIWARVDITESVIPIFFAVA
jgi:hypothetical protein